MFASFRFIISRQIVLGAISLDLFAYCRAAPRLQCPSTPRTFWKSAQSVSASSGLGHRQGTSRRSLFHSGPDPPQSGIKLQASVVAFGLATVNFGFFENFWLNLVMLFCRPPIQSVSSSATPSCKLLRRRDSRPHQHRKFGFYWCLQRIERIQVRVTAAWWGAMPAVVVGCIGTICVALAFGRKIPQLREADSLEPNDLIRKYQ